MERQRFISFRADFHKLYNIIIKDRRSETISSQFTALRQVYPELDFNVALPDLVVKDATVPMPMDVDINMRTEKRLSSVGIKEKFLASVAETKFVVYDNYVPNLENEDTCLESLQELEKAIVGSRRRIVYFSCLQGEVLKRLKDITGKKMHKILKLTPYSQFQAYFLINMHKLSQDYSRIMYSSLPIRFFKNNLKTITSICESDAAKFQLREAKTIQRFETSNCLRVHYDYFISLMREIWNDGYMH